MIQKCEKGCKNEYQDRRYGAGIRVHTTDKKGGHHCTVCGGLPSWWQKLATHAR